MKAVQLKMARIAVGWGVRELAAAAGVTANTVTRIENGADAKQSTIEALASALTRQGVVFTESDGAVGVMYRTKEKSDKGEIEHEVSLKLPARS